MLQLENVTVKVGPKVILDDVSAAFHAGKMNLIIGPNGSGKSTLVKAASKQLTFDGGSVKYNGNDIKNMTYQQLATFRAVLSQQTEVAFPLKVWEVVMMGRYPHFTTQPGSRDEQAVEEAMKYFNVWPMAERDYVTLSGGEKQRVNFARVLSQIWFSEQGQMRYLLLDEPLTFLDVNFQYQFMHRLEEFMQKNAMVVVGVVHDLNLAARFADSILLLNEGKVLVQGTPQEVLTPGNIEKAFNIKPEILKQKDSFYISF
ncbi:MAG TPA: heme ABC transporter ATP-binding protein [Cyclobacteriaceae bacterium]|jgi:iron complex transport system ATP-binding protein|nr:heme ABC transporter ATP-binding protein [Cyclobacteriaceae bacterium]